MRGGISPTPSLSTTTRCAVAMHGRSSTRISSGTTNHAYVALATSYENGCSWNVLNAFPCRVDVPLKAGMSISECRDRTGRKTEGTCAEQYRLPPAGCLEHQWYYYPQMTKEEASISAIYVTALCMIVMTVALPYACTSMQGHSCTLAISLARIQCVFAFLNRFSCSPSMIAMPIATLGSPSTLRSTTTMSPQTCHRGRVWRWAQWKCALAALHMIRCFVNVLHMIRCSVQVRAMAIYIEDSMPRSMGDFGAQNITYAKVTPLPSPPEYRL